ncbi:RHS repeat-associated core domain-containing protein [Flavobacterium stagni]|uniref:RHS repeat-associated core domain-containing protein n=1 Tax=Flavobacterium stagni TaxID=2506421 RepID=UPI0021D10730|nr:RHS repeat-associated core domain-containing protein [Flavobacterium stagni]
MAYKYKYNGKEYQDELGLNMYDYGARNYDAALGRWMNIDPLAEKRPYDSNYIFCGNNPLSNLDPDGKYFFGLFGSSSSERRMARAEKFAKENGGSVVMNEKGRPTVNILNSEGNGIISYDKFGDFSSWKNFGNTLGGFIKTLDAGGSGGNEYTGTQGMREFGEDLGKGSTYVKGAGVIITASSVVFGPEVAPVGIGIYDAGSGMDDVSTALQVTADIEQGKGAQATTRVLGLVAGKVADGVIDKNVSGSVSQTILKHRADNYIGLAKDNKINSLDKKKKK